MWLTLPERNEKLEQKTQADWSPHMGRVNQLSAQLPPNTDYCYNFLTAYGHWGHWATWCLLCNTASLGQGLYFGLQPFEVCSLLSPLSTHCSHCYSVLSLVATCVRAAHRHKRQGPTEPWRWQLLTPITDLNDKRERIYQCPNELPCNEKLILVPHLGIFQSFLVFFPAPCNPTVVISLAAPTAMQ